MTKYILLALVLTLVLLALTSSEAIEVQASSSPLLLMDGVSFPDSQTARVCVFIEGLWGTPEAAGFTLSGTLDYDGGLIDFSLPVQEMEYVTDVGPGNAYVMGFVPLAPNPPPVYPDSAMACAQLKNKSGVVIADGECGAFPCSLFPF